jgi:microcystin-dependent protein
MATVTIVRTSNASQLNSLLSQASASTIYLAQTSASTTYLTQTSASSAYAAKSLEATVAALSATPVGTIVMYGASAQPTGWLLCNGQSTSGYPALAAVVGATVPDLRGRAPIGWGTSSDAGINARTTIGDKTGAETHALTQSEMPRHQHGASPAMIIGGGSGGIANYAPTGNNPQEGLNTTFTGGSGTANEASNGIAHNNMQPSTVVNFIIKT